MSFRYIIDGYNVCRHSAFSPFLKNKNQITALIDFIRLKNPCGRRLEAVAVVFDGYPDYRSAVSASARSRIEVIFSGSCSADEKIRKMLEECKRPRETKVVSDDREVFSYARLLQAVPVRVEEFLMVQKKQHASRKDAACEEKLSYSEMSSINRELRKLWLEE